MHERQSLSQKRRQDVLRFIEIHLSDPKLNAEMVAQAEAGNYDGQRGRLTEMDALVAYLQMLGTLVDFRKYDEGYFAQFR